MSSTSAQMAELKQIWFTQAEADCEQISQLIETLAQSPHTGDETCENLYRIFHDMQGQAGVFGYPLLATLGSKFCRFWRGVKVKEAATPEDINVAQAHLLALRFILEKRLEGCGGAAGQTIMEKLDAIVAETAPQPSSPSVGTCPRAS